MKKLLLILAFPIFFNLGYAQQTFTKNSTEASIELIDLSLEKNRIERDELIEITLKIKNVGNNSIQSVEIWYQAGQNEKISEIINDVDLLPDEETQFVFKQKLGYMPSDNYTVKSGVSRANGMVVEPMYLSEILYVEGYSILNKMALMEWFSSVTCKPCRNFNAVFLPKLKEKSNWDKCVINKCQTRIPGVDFYYNEDVGVRMDYYEVFSVTSLFINGRKIETTIAPDVIQAIFDTIENEYNKPAEADIKGTFQISNKKAKIKAVITPFVSGEYKVFVSVNQKVMTHYVEELRNVVMNMFPDGNGLTYNFEVGVPIIIELESDLWERVHNYQDMEVTIFIQKEETKDVLASAIALERDPVLLMPPLNLTSQIENSNITLTWELPNSSLSVIGYNVYRDDSLIAENISELTYTEENLDKGIYRYFVVANYEEGMISACAVNDIEITSEILPPSNINISTLDYKIFDITWDASVSEGVLGYDLYREGTKINDELIITTEYSDSVIYEGVYSYKIKAITNTEESKYSEKVNSPSFPPPAPLNTQVKQIMSEELSINVLWERPLEVVVDGYNIYRDGVKINTTLITTLNYKDVVPNAGNYCYTVSALKDDKEGEKSQSACIDVNKRFIIPGNIEAMQIENGKLEVLIQWDSISSVSIDGFYIYRDSIKLNTTPVNNFQYTDMVEDFQREYCYNISTEIDGVEGHLSEPLFISLKNDVGIKETNQEITDIRIYPNPVNTQLILETVNTNISGYIIYDINGRLIFKGEEKDNVIYVDNWSSGIYVVRIMTEKGVIFKQIIKR